ncbi:MAG: SGNH/GDSL hydrolase family protein, partial [Roseobacter sp.]|nr:SGNH/GDSL hydrolase family protein [Roseobacter sp.]
MMPNTATGNTRRQEILTGIIVLSLSFGGFLIGEIGLRTLQLARYGVQATVEKSEAFFTDESSGLRLIHPNQQLGKVRINNLGFRGPDIGVDKDSGKIRLLFLGSSTTYDAGSPEGENWPEQTVRILKQSLPGCELDFVNAGQPGYSTASMARLYDSKLRGLDSDMAIVFPGDVNQDLDWQAKQEGFDTNHYHPSWLAKHSVLWGKLELNFRVIELQRQA